MSVFSGRASALFVILLGAALVAGCGGLIPTSDGCKQGEVRLCYTGDPVTRNVGNCQAGMQACSSGKWGPCLDEVLPTAESCHTPFDDDCNGLVNELGSGCVCTPGALSNCYSGPSATLGVGPCKGGKQQCNAQGTGFGPCVDEVVPALETCATPEDDNCNGEVNEPGALECVCASGTTSPCYTGTPGTEGVGACTAGTRECNATGTAWGACTGEVLPVAESCATPVDDDCDGQANEGCVCAPNSTRSCYSGPAGTADVGQCKSGTQTCNAQGSSYGPCTGEVLPGVETCTAPGDEDCNGLANEGGAGCVCAPGSTSPCYGGPAGTAGVGMCKEGMRVCLSSGTGYGSCLGEVTPAQETCNTPGDDDCDGQINEDGPGCACPPGATQPCYSGPAGTQGVGICQGGTQTCNAQGTGWSGCAGEVLPQVENCNTAADENCDGQTPPCAGLTPIIDLRADVNRNGVIDLTDPTEDANEDVWTPAAGAIFLANIDDDQGACPVTNQTDAQLAACNDAADNVVNGVDDLEDLARLKTVPWPQAPSNASATVTVSAPGATYVRLFKKVGNSFTAYTPGATLTAAELQAGLEFAIEGKTFVRDAAVWNGKVKVTLNVTSGTGPSGPLPNGSDTVELRVAPVIFRHHLDLAQKTYVTSINSSSSIAFRNDLLSAVTFAGVPQGLLQMTGTGDQWTQDWFETAYMSMPAPGGQQKVIHVNFRSPNYTNALRSAGRLVYTQLRGKDVAGATVYDPGHPNSMDSLNSFGNLETLPPYNKGATTYTLGKVLRGSVPSYYPDLAFDKMIAGQSVQGILTIDTAWLLVSHVDETLSFIKASSPRGWVMLAADPALGKSKLQTAQSQGFGSTQMFVGKCWTGSGGSCASAAISINQVLADPDVMNESAWAATKIAGQVAAIKAETGLTNGEIVPIASLFDKVSGYSVAYEPGIVNGIYLSNTVFGAPNPHGPVIGGQDIFKSGTVTALAPYGITVRWIENWDLYHRNLGEVHCGSNTTRAVPANIKWWESGL